MAIPPFFDDPEKSRPFFARLRTLGEQYGLREFSMGMSHDFEVAIEEGATMVRVGTALFGERAMTAACRIKIRVIPNARKTGFAGYREDELLLRLNAPALEGKANKAAAEFIAEYFALPRSSVALVAGEKSRHKVFEIIGLGIGDIERKVGRPAAQNH